MRRRQRAAAAAALLILAMRAAPAAHEIPRDVMVHVQMKPEGERLRVLVRVPLAAMRDIDFPQHPDGSLDMTRVDPLLRNAAVQWIVPVVEIREGADLLGPPAIVATRATLPSDTSFRSWDDALGHVTAAPQAEEIHLPWNQALLDVLLEYPIQSAESRFSIRPGFERLGVQVVTAIRLVTPAGVRGFELRGDPGVVHLDPRWHQAAWQFTKLGFFHILEGIDHLLFLVCLVIPFRRLRPLILVVTAFTVAHSITLVASAAGLAPDALWFPPLVETLIAASIVYLAIENILTNGTTARRWIVAFGFGLVHGFGFSFGLTQTLQFAGSHLALSLLSFNVGVEIGQVLVLLALVPALHAVFRFGVPERMGTIVLSAVVAHTAWHWMAERWSALREFPFPAADAALLLGVTRVLLVLVVVAAVVWIAIGRTRRLEVTGE